MALRADDVDLGRDRVLVERYQAGDHAAFDDLYRRYFARLTRYCARRVHNDDAAEEIAQEAFVRALRALPRLDGDRRFYPWMTVIASRLCVDHHRANARVEVTESIDGGPTWDDDHVADAVDLRYLDLAMARLAPRHREVLDLRERRGLTYSEIAGHLDVNQGTVEALLHRARRALRREFHTVSGEKLGRLATLPGLTWVSERILRLRERYPEALDAIRPLAVGAASIVIIAAPVAIGRVGDKTHSPAAPESAVSSPYPEWPLVPHNAALDSIEGASPTADRDLAAARGPAGTADDDSRTIVGVRGPQVGIDDTSPRDKVRNEQVVATVGPAIVGVDPGEVSNDTARNLSKAIRPLHEIIASSAS